MYTLKVKTFLCPQDFNFKAFDDCITIRQAVIPRLGDQMLQREVLQLVKSFYDEFEDDPDVYDFKPLDYTYVANIGYGDNDVIYVGLSHSPSKYLVYMFDNDRNSLKTWKLLPALPETGDLVDYHEACRLPDTWRKVLSVVYSDLIVINTTDKEDDVPTDVKVVNSYPMPVEVCNNSPVTVNVNGKVGVDVQDVRCVVTTKKYEFDY